MRNHQEIDWTGCELVESIPGKVSGQPVVKGTRVLADTIVEDFDLGSSVSEISDNYELNAPDVERLIAHAHSRKPQLQP